MTIALIILMFLLAMTFLASLAAIVRPFKMSGLQSRKEAAQAMGGSALLFSVLAVIFFFVTHEKSGEVTAANDVEPVEESAAEPQEATLPVDLSRDEWRADAVQAVANEASVVDAMFPPNSRSSFWVSVRDDGSRRDGFAEYVCLVLMEHGMPEGAFLVIKVWDAARLAADEFREIGRYECGRH